MRTVKIKANLLALLVAGAVGLGFAGRAEGSLPRNLQVETDPAPSDVASPKVETHIVVETGEADSSAPAARQERRVIVRTPGAGEAEEKDADAPHAQQKKVIVLSRTGAGHGGSTAKDVAWLGVATEEPSDALVSQLDLQRGEGLLVTYVATNSPAAKAGLQKNDLLVEMDGQKLVLPAQLRKLVQMRNEGDKVGLVYYRKGKKQTASATLGKTKTDLSLFGDSGGLDGFKQVRFQLHDLSSMDGLNEHVKELHESLARSGVDRENIQLEVRRGVDQARKAIAEAMAQVHDKRGNASATAKALEELARSGVEVDKDATVTIKSRKDSVRTMVKTDDTGSCVLVANPKKRLTAHDKDGKLIFDGEIETSEQQAKVPRDVWKKVELMIEQLNQSKDNPPAIEEPPPKKTSAAPDGNPTIHSSRLKADLHTLASVIRYLLEPERPLAPTPKTNREATGRSAGAGA
jgi:hypothetical protein